MMNKIVTPFLAGIVIFWVGCLTTEQVKAQTGLKIEDKSFSQTVLIHPVIEGDLISSEHTYNPDLRLGDQLGRDFTTGKLSAGIFERYRTNGKTNGDWYGWRKNVLAPFDATVTRVNHPDTTNKPGVMNREAQPGLIFFQNEDSVTVIYAHAREIKVEEGQQVKAGEVVAKVGNNGNSRNPHIHVGAWKGDIPLQIQVDLYAEERFGEEKENATK